LKKADWRKILAGFALNGAVLILIKKSLLEKMYESASMRRWNDKITPVELRELDKQAHKMILAYVIGKFEEGNRRLSWVDIIEGGIFEFLQRLVLTDLKPQIFDQIKKDEDTYRKLNQWIFRKLKPMISSIGNSFYNRFEDYFSNTTETINRRILRAAHFYATKWEFDIIERANPNGYEIPEIKQRITKKLEQSYDLDGIKRLVMYSDIRSFVDLCGQLRFQLRWSHVHMAPRTSVLGHMLIVAMLAYLFSLEIGACERRRVNNYFTGLFHDLPEVLTRDIVSPVKGAVKGLKRMIKKYEKKQMDEEVYTLLPRAWHKEIKMFAEREFDSVVTINGKRVRKTSNEIQENYNHDEFDPRDGEIVKAVDHLAAYIEAHMAIENGITSPHLQEAKIELRRKYEDEESIAGIDFGAIYADFKS
jgi:putative hydrolase of HD superfamily